MSSSEDPEEGRPLSPEEYGRYRADMERKKKESVIKHWPWYLLLGIVLLVLGIVGLGMIPVVTLTTVAVFGIFFTIAGILLMIAGIVGYGGRWFPIILGFIYLIIGVVMLEEPAGTIKFVTFVIGAGFIISGLLRVLVGFKGEGGGMLLFAGALDLLLGGLILAHWPESSPWVIGLFVSIELLMGGLSFIALSLSARELKNNPKLMV